MIVEIIPTGGIGRAEPVVLDAAQIVIRLDDGTPVVAAAHYGPENSYVIGSLGHDQEEFHRILRSLGIHSTVLVTKLPSHAPLQGARLLVGPR